MFYIYPSLKLFKYLFALLAPVTIASLCGTSSLKSQHLIREMFADQGTVTHKYQTLSARYTADLGSEYNHDTSGICLCLSRKKLQVAQFEFDGTTSKCLATFGGISSIGL